MKELLKKKVTRKQFLKSGLGLIAGALAGVLIGSNLKSKTCNKNNSYGSGAYGGGS